MSKTRRSAWRAQVATHPTEPNVELSRIATQQMMQYFTRQDSSREVLSTSEPSRRRRSVVCCEYGCLPLAQFLITQRLAPKPSDIQYR